GRHGGPRLVRDRVVGRECRSAGGFRASQEVCDLANAGTPRFRHTFPRHTAGGAETYVRRVRSLAVYLKAKNKIVRKLMRCLMAGSAVTRDRASLQRPSRRHVLLWSLLAAGVTAPASA